MDSDQPDSEDGPDSTHIVLQRLLRRERSGPSALPPRLAQPTTRQRFTAASAVLLIAVLIVGPLLAGGPQTYVFLMILSGTNAVGAILLSLVALLVCLPVVEWALRFERERTTISAWATACGGILGGVGALLLTTLDRRGVATAGTLLLLPTGIVFGALAGTYPTRRSRGVMTLVLLAVFVALAGAMGFVWQAMMSPTP